MGKTLSHKAQGTQRKTLFVFPNPADSEAPREKLFLCHTQVDGMETELKEKPKSLPHTARRVRREEWIIENL